MGIFDKLSKTAKDKFGEIENTENFSQSAQIKAVDIIKELSGSATEQTKKIPDNVIVFTSTSGAGASTLAANVAYAASNDPKLKLRVVLIDLNIMFPAQNIYFETKQELDLPDLVTYLLGKSTLGDSIVNKGNISLMFADNKEIMDSINCESDIAIDNFTDMINKLRSLYDLVIIDCPMKIDHTLCNTAFYLCDQIYLVWDEGLSSIANAEKIRRNMAVTGIDSYTKMHIILNKRTNVKYTDFPFKKLNVNLAGILPFDPAIIDSSLKSQIFIEKGASKSENANVFASKIYELTNTIVRNGGLV